MYALPTLTEIELDTAFRAMELPRNGRESRNNKIVIELVKRGHGYWNAERAMNAVITANAAFEHAVITGAYTGYLK